MNRLPLILLAFMLFAGCTMSSSEPIPQTYRLTPTVNPVNETPMAHIKLGNIETSPGLDDSRIILHVLPYRIDHYAAARWPIRLPEYLDAVILEGLSLSQTAQSISQGSLSGLPNYKLQIRVLDFQTEYKTSVQDTPDMHIRMELTLQRSRGQRIILHDWYESRITSTDNNMTAIIKKFNEAFQEIFDNITVDVNKAITDDLSTQEISSQ